MPTCLPTCPPIQLTLISLLDLPCLDTFAPNCLHTCAYANSLLALPLYFRLPLFLSSFVPLAISATAFLIPSIPSLFSVVGLEAFSCRSFAIKLEDSCLAVCQRTGARTHVHTPRAEQPLQCRSFGAHAHLRRAEYHTRATGAHLRRTVSYRALSPPPPKTF